jgi:hypothetical protein
MKVFSKLHFSSTESAIQCAGLNWSEKGLLPILWSLVIGIVGVGLIAYRSLALDAPVYGPDELAYWLNAQLLDIEQGSYPQGPMVGAVKNYVFLLLLAAIQSFEEAIPVLRIVNFLLLVLAAWLILGISREILPRNQSLLAASFVFLTGISVYSVASMPEIFLMVLFLIQIWLIMRWWSPGQLAIPAAIGLLAGGMILTKPHGVAIGAGMVFGILSYAALFGRRKVLLRDVSKDVVVALCFCYLSICGIRSLFEGQLVLSPLGFSGPVYAGIASKSFETLGLYRLVLGSFWFACAHAAVLSAIYSPAIWGNLLCLVEERQRGEPGSKHALLSMMVFGVFASMLVLVSAFSFSIGTSNPFEANRLHVRYWAFLAPLLFTVALSSLSAQRRLKDPKLRRTSRVVETLGVLTGCIALFFIFAPQMRLFPWDAPDLFALYQQGLQDWNHQAMVPQSIWIMGLLFAVLCVCTATGRFRLPCYAVVVSLFVGFGNIRTTEWQLVHMRDVTPLIQEARTLAAATPPKSTGAILTDDPWGRLSYIRYHLPPRTSVVRLPQTNELAISALPDDAEWVVAPSSVDLSKVGSLTLVRRLSLLSLYQVQAPNPAAVIN